MKEEIQKIMAMVKNGTLTDNQGAELLAALVDERQAAKDPAPGQESERSAGSGRGTGAKRTARDESFGDLAKGATELADKATRWASKMIESAAGEKSWQSFGDVLRGKAKLHTADEQGNSVIMSRFDPPTGEGSHVTDNSIQVSSVSGLKFVDATFKGNSVQASKLQDLSLTRATMDDSSFSGSSVDRLTMTEAKVSDTRFNGSRAAGLTLTDASLDDCSFNGSNLKALTIEDHSSLEDCSFSGANVTDVVLKAVHFEDCSLEGVNFADSRFEQVKLSDCRFHKVKMTRVTLRNISLEDQLLEDFTLTDQDIDGTEAFLAATKR